MRDKGNKWKTKGCVHLRWTDVQRQRRLKTGWFKSATGGILKAWKPDIPVFSVAPCQLLRINSNCYGQRKTDRKVKLVTVTVLKQRELQVSYCACCFPLPSFLWTFSYSSHFYFINVLSFHRWRSCHLTKVSRSTGVSKWPYDRSNEHFFISSCLIVYWSQTGRNYYIISLVGPCHYEQLRLVTLHYRHLVRNAT